MNADESNKNLSIKQTDQDQATWHDLLQQLPKTEVPAEIDQTILQAAAQRLDSSIHGTILPKQTQATYTLWQRWASILKKPWFSSLFAGGLAASVATVVWLKQPDPLAGLPKAESAETAKTVNATTPTVTQENQKNEETASVPSAAGMPVGAANPVEQNTALPHPAQAVPASRADKTDKVAQKAQETPPPPKTQSSSDTNTSKTQASNTTQTARGQLDTTPDQDAKSQTNQTNDTSDANKHKPSIQQQKTRKEQEKREIEAETSISSVSKDTSEAKSESKGTASSKKTPPAPSEFSSPAPAAPVAASSAPPESTAAGADTKKDTAQAPIKVDELDINKQTTNKQKSPSSPRAFGSKDKTINSSTPKETEKTPGLASTETIRSKEHNTETNIIAKKQHAKQCFHDIEIQIKNESNDPTKIKANIAACQRAYPNTRLSSTIQQFLTAHP